MSDKKTKIEIDLINKSIKFAFKGFSKNLNFIKAAHYTILPTGHRYRSLLSLEIYKAFGGNKKDFLKCVAGIECIHHATLIFDDLPSMDNSPLRKSKPTTHLKFGQSTAILAALFLENIGKQLIHESMKDHGLYVKSVIKILEEIDKTSMDLIRGQSLDLKNSRSEKELEQVLRNKNQMFYLACVLPVLFLNKTTYLKTFKDIGNKISVAYQLFDDLRDIESTKKITGKLVGVDKDKNTSVYKYGVSKVKLRLNRLEEGILDNLKKIKNSERLTGLVHVILNKKS